MIYICDDSDSRAYARKRLFDRWYNQHIKVGARFTRYEFPIEIDDDGTVYFAALICRLDNPYQVEMYMAFRRLALGEK